MVNWRMLIGNLGGNGSDGRKASTALMPEQLRRTVDSTSLGFRTTADLVPITGLIGQDRAVEAIRFGVSIKQPDFNLFVLGPNESGKTTAVRDFLEEKARSETSPHDWVYVNNFRDPDKPNAIALPKGRAERLAAGMIETINDLKSSLPAMFDSEEYLRRRKSIEVEFRGQHERAIEQLTEKAKAEKIALVRTETGFGMAPMLDGGMMPPEVFQKLPEAEREAITKRIGELQQELGSIVEDVPRLQKEHFQRMQALNEEFASIVVRRAIADVESRQRRPAGGGRLPGDRARRSRPQCRAVPDEPATGERQRRRRASRRVRRSWSSRSKRSATSASAVTSSTYSSPTVTSGRARRSSRS